VQARVFSRGSNVAATAEINGAVVTTKDGVFLANRIDDAFAIVDVGAADVDVLYENRRTAVTGSDGKALVTGLRSYQKAKISIDPANLPVGADVPRTEVEVAPGDRSGVAVDFGVRRDVPSAVVVFRSPDGAFLPPGSRGRIENREGEFVIGYDGQVFLKDLEATTRVVVSSAGQDCRATIVHAHAPGQALIDPVVCRR
jgi:outer membrane usher protein